MSFQLNSGAPALDDRGEVWSVGEILEEWKEMRRELEEDDDVAG